MPATRERPASNGIATDDQLIDKETEYALLGAIILRPSIYQSAREVVAPFDFGNLAARAVFKAMGDVAADCGNPGDLSYLTQRLKQSGDLPGVVSYATLGEMQNAVSTSAGWELAAASVKESSGKRRLGEIIDVARAGVLRGENPFAVASWLKADVDSFSTWATPTVDRFGVLNAAEFDAACLDVNYIVDDVLVEHQPMIVAGVMKSMKTSVVLDLGLAIATARPFLGKFRVPEPKRVLTISGESGGATIQETCRRISDAYGERFADAGDRFLISSYIPSIDNADDLSALESLLRRHEVDVLIVDPIYLMMSGVDAGNIFVQGERLRAFANMCAGCSVTPILCHHARKGVAEGERLDLSSISFSGFAEFGRQFLLLNRREKYAFDGIHRLWMSLGGSAGHGGAWGVDIVEGTRTNGRRRIWQPSILTTQEVEEQRGGRDQQSKQDSKAIRVQEDARAIVAKMLDFPDGETERRIRDACNLSGQRAGPAFALLRSDGTIEDIEITRNRRPWPAVKLVDHELD